MSETPFRLKGPGRVRARTMSDSSPSDQEGSPESDEFTACSDGGRIGQSRMGQPPITAAGRADKEPLPSIHCCSLNKRMTTSPVFSSPRPIVEAGCSTPDLESTQAESFL